MLDTVVWKGQGRDRAGIQGLGIFWRTVFAGVTTAGGRCWVRRMRGGWPSSAPAAAVGCRCGERARRLDANCGLACALAALHCLVCLESGRHSGSGALGVFSEAFGHGRVRCGFREVIVYCIGKFRPWHSSQSGVLADQ